MLILLKAAFTVAAITSPQDIPPPTPYRNGAVHHFYLMDAHGIKGKNEYLCVYIKSNGEILEWLARLDGCYDEDLDKMLDKIEMF